MSLIKKQLVPQVMLAEDNRLSKEVMAFCPCRARHSKPSGSVMAP
jgi:hypothetical protein